MRPTPDVSEGPHATRLEIEAQLARIDASPDFKVPERARQFLRYVITEALEGRADRLKAYSIATEVFGRDASFDAQNDPVVRIEAGRLRRALERYYLLAGHSDTVLINIPKGGYVPTFDVRHATSVIAEIAPEPQLSSVQAPQIGPVSPVSPRSKWARIAAVVVLLVAVFSVAAYLARGSSRFSARDEIASSPTGPAVAVAPFVDLGEGPDTKLYAAGLTEEIIAQLARFKELTIPGRETTARISPIVDPARLQRDFGARFAVEGSLRLVGNNRLRVTARLIDLETSVILWSQTYDDDLRTQDILTIEQDVAEKIASAVAQPYGIIFRADTRRAERKTTADIEAYSCTLRFYAYRNELSATAHAGVRSCLEQAVARYPDYATAWAMLSYLYLDEMRFGFNPRAGEPAPTRRALTAAETAAQLDPDNARAIQAQMTMLFFTGQPNEGRRIGERALTLNPNDSELLGEYGSRIAMSGDWERGTTLLERALILNSGNAGFYKGMLALAAYMQGDTDRAVDLVRKADLQRFALYQAVAAIIYADKGMKAETVAAKAAFLSMQPRFFDDLDMQLSVRGISPQDRQRLADGAIKAGFPVMGKNVLTSAP
ncbi:adenylate cyclase [Microvirga antarctica]|uniref:adenylate cyclase n=1 Tax=Microvirga antarctica TaxID=2819233 RepID=UPI001B300DB8|nr:adenylate cyclase [Microvirga antarctica]